MEQAELKMDELEENSSRSRWTYGLFAALHTLGWFLVACLSQSNAPFDHIEMVYWGHEWQWGYYKHPPLTAWLAELASQLFGNRVWPVYLLSVMCILGCFQAVWRLGRGVLSPWSAVLAVLLITPSVYFGWSSTEFNNNISAKVCWAMFILCLYRGIHRGGYGWWLSTGLWLGGAVLSKYDAGLLLLSCAGFSLVHASARQRWKTAGPWLMVLTTAIVISPHLWWMWSNDFATLQYLKARVGAKPTVIGHLLNPLGFLGAQLAAVAPCLLLASLILRWPLKRRVLEGEPEFARQYLTWVLLGPVVLACLFSAVSGGRLRSMWGAAMFTYMGAVLLLWFEHRTDRLAIRRFLLCAAGLGLLMALGASGRNALGGYYRDKVSRVDFPGERLSRQVREIWSQQTSAPLKYTGGDWWLCGNVGAYLSERPSVYTDLNERLAPWMNDAEFKRQGGMILWQEPDAGEEYRAILSTRFPEAKLLETLTIASERFPNQQPVTIGMAIMRPESSAE